MPCKRPCSVLNQLIPCPSKTQDAEAGKAFELDVREAQQQRVGACDSFLRHLLPQNF